MLHELMIIFVDNKISYCNCFFKVCCPSGTYGMNCRECAGGRARPCKGNGRCVVRNILYND